MKGILYRIGSALAVRLAGLEDLHREEQEIYRNALLKQQTGKNIKKVQKVPALNRQDKLLPHKS